MFEDCRLTPAHSALWQCGVLRYTDFMWGSLECKRLHMSAMRGIANVRSRLSVSVGAILFSCLVMLYYATCRVSQESIVWQTTLIPLLLARIWAQLMNHKSRELFVTLLKEVGLSITPARLESEPDTTRFGTTLELILYTQNLTLWTRYI